MVAGDGGAVGRPVSGRGSTRWILIWDVGRQGTERRAEPPLHTFDRVRFRDKRGRLRAGRSRASIENYARMASQRDQTSHRDVYRDVKRNACRERNARNRGEIEFHGGRRRNRKAGRSSTVERRRKRVSFTAETVRQPESLHVARATVC